MANYEALLSLLEAQSRQEEALVLISTLCPSQEVLATA
jgi:hypothetical protein